MFDSYIQGFLTTTALLIIEHAVLYARLKKYGDVGVSIKFIIGTLAFLAGCAVIAWQEYEPSAFFAPLTASFGGAVILAGYVGRWLWRHALDSAYIRGRLAGLSDHADIAEDRDGG